MIKFVGPFTQLVTMGEVALKGPLKDEMLTVIPHAGILIDGESIYQVGGYDDLLAEARKLDASFIELTEDYVALPGFIDTHTHLCFAGSRANDYALRNAGKTYLEIAHAGGGIWDTVTKTRQATEDVLINGLLHRATRQLHQGITTMEVKSGYGLSVAEELKMLRAIKTAASQITADVVATCLAAHMKPKDFDGTAAAYLQQITAQLFPALLAEGLACRVDAFIEESAFSPASIAPYFKQAQQLGLAITVHADQFTTGGSQVAIDFGAVSADHLEASTDKEIAALAQSSVIATALPGASLGLGVGFTPARRILDAGGALAIASDWNPGSAPMGHLLTQAAILGTYEKLTNAEVLAGITCRAAAALQLPDRGRLTPGLLADLVIFPTASYQEILYQQGQLAPAQVWKRGACIVPGETNTL